MSENEVKINFFGLSYSSQIKILELYLNDIKMFDSSDYEKIFEKYLIVIKKFYDFKGRFKLFSDDDRKRMRMLIYKCRSKINPNNVIEIDDLYNCHFSCIIDDSVIDKYIYDFFSYSCEERFMIASDFFDYYSDIADYNFGEILGLFDYNRDFFNNEIRKISGDFYSLYLFMNTVDRMKYIWYLCNFDVFTSEHVVDNIDMYHIFESDRVFINPLHLGSKEVLGSSKKLSKYFKVN